MPTKSNLLSHVKQKGQARQEYASQLSLIQVRSHETRPSKGKGKDVVRAGDPGHSVEEKD